MRNNALAGSTRIERPTTELYRTATLKVCVAREPNFHSIAMTVLKSTLLSNLESQICPKLFGADNESVRAIRFLHQHADYSHIVNVYNVIGRICITI